MDDALVMLRTLRVADASMRQQSALERMAAASDREAAAADRERAAADRHAARLDALTGVLRRETGEVALAHEIDRSRRSGRSLVIAVIDIDALKAVNDNEGRADDDALLRDVPAAITLKLRSYDVTVRWSGDEFICAMSDLTLEAASDRAAELQRALEAGRPGTSISVGLAELRDDDTLESLIARAAPPSFGP
jgi:diguanylate cyclase (GGDEF)-like protein